MGEATGEDPRVKGFEVYREGFPLWPKDVEKVGKIIKATEEMKMKSMQRLEYMLIGSCHLFHFVCHFHVVCKVYVMVFCCVICNVFFYISIHTLIRCTGLNKFIS